MKINQSGHLSDEEKSAQKKQRGSSQIDIDEEIKKNRCKKRVKGVRFG